MSDQEPIDTRTPWYPRSRTQRAPLTQVEYERQMYEAMTRKGRGQIHAGSLSTPTYEPNRAMAPGAQSIINKKGLRPKEEHSPVTPTDRLVYAGLGICTVLILGIIGFMLIKLG